MQFVKIEQREVIDGLKATIDGRRAAYLRAKCHIRAQQLGGLVLLSFMGSVWVSWKSEPQLWSGHQFLRRQIILQLLVYTPALGRGLRCERTAPDQIACATFQRITCDALPKQL